MRDYWNNKSVQDGAVVLALGLALGVFSVYSFTHSPVKAAWIMSPYLFPMLIACFAVGVGVCLLVEGKHEVERETSVRLQSVDLKKVLCAAGLTLAYYFLLPVLTFIPTTAVFLYAFMSFLGEKRRSVMLLAVLVTLTLYGLFAFGLNVRLP